MSNTIDLTAPTYEVTLGGDTYTTRPYTNALRVKLAPLLAERSKLNRVGRAIQLEAQQISARDAADVDPGDLDVLDDRTDEHNKALEEVYEKLAIQLIADVEGKAITKAKLADAGVDRIDQIVSVVIDGGEPDPSPASSGNG